MGILTREQILQADDLRRELVAVPEWGGQVYVRSLTGTERDQFEASFITVNGMDTQLKLENIRAQLVSMTAVDDDGKRLFSAADVQALASKNAAALQRLFETAQKLSGLSKEDVKELAKN